jgi:hypothetical protein
MYIMCVHRMHSTAASADDIKRFETYIKRTRRSFSQAVRVPPGHSAVRRGFGPRFLGAERNIRRLKRIVAVLYTVYVRVRCAYTYTYIYIYILYVHVYCILYVNTDLVFSAEGMRVPQCVYIYVRVCV